MTNTEWLSEAEMAAWLRLIAVVQLLPGALEGPLQEENDLTHYEYFTLAILSEAPDHTLRMTALAAATNATLPRLSHVIRRLEERGFVERFPCPTDRRATNARLTEEGWQRVLAAAPGHVRTVRHHVIDALTPAQIGELTAIAGQILHTLDPEGPLALPAPGPGEPGSRSR